MFGWSAKGERDVGGIWGIAILVFVWRPRHDARASAQILFQAVQSCGLGTLDLFLIFNMF